MQKKSKFTEGLAPVEEVSSDDERIVNSREESGEVSFEELNILKNENEELKQKLAEYEELLKRKVAEFDNYRKRVQKEKVETIKLANKELILELLPVIDNLERALEAGKKGGDVDSLVKGVDMVYKQLMAVLSRYGVEPIESVGQEFDPALHEVLAVEEREDVETDTVVADFQKGYLIHGQVLRPSKVKVARAIPSAGESEDENSKSKKEK